MIEHKPELRYNLMTGDWVVVSPDRGRRPHPHAQMPPTNLGPAFVQTCPFCAGNEAETLAETARVEGPTAWFARAVENRFPALAPTGELERDGEGYERSMTGIGRHEVIVESPHHNTMMALLPVDRVRDVLTLYRERTRAIYADSRVEHVIVFKNHGEAAGSTLDHPHSQIVGTPVVPGQVRVRIEEALRQYGQLGECLYCYCMRQEIAGEVRIVEETPTFVALIPYAALSPFHIWIVPKRHCAYFGGATDDELTALAGILQRTLRRLDLALGNPHFNYVIRSLSPPEEGVKYYHWYLSIVVRLTRSAGFELGTGMYINTALPEESARRLREVALDEAPLG